MNALCEKVFLTVDEASEDDIRSDARRLLDALAQQGFGQVELSLKALQQLYPACREGAITVTVAHCRPTVQVLRIEAGDCRDHCYALACDYGSTTIVMQLVDLACGKVVCQASAVNGQVAFGTDILTRITHTLAESKGASQLRQATLDTFNGLFAKLEEESGIHRREYGMLVISGNVTMIHFLLGLSAWPVFSSPYKPVTLSPGFMECSSLGLELPGMAFIMPGASNYVGGDIMSGLLNVDFYDSDEVSLFFDVGTNGELVMGCKDWLLGGAGAAGPALEGYISKHGLRAQPGAIDSVTIEDGFLRYTTIDAAPAVGICGSGIIDLVASLRLAGWMAIDGTLVEGASDAVVRVGEGDDEQLAVVYSAAQDNALGEDLVFTQTDINQYLETKAAARTMVDCMLDAAGLVAQDVKHLYLSGAFCAHANLESAIVIGMFPDVERNRYSCIRNSSLDGARELLLDRSKLDVLDRLVSNIFCVQFASMPDFMLRMRAAKFVPHTNMDEYPSVRQALQERGIAV